MSQFAIKSATDRDRAIAALKARKMPFTVSIQDRVKRSIEQNRLQRLWLQEAAEQLGEDTPEGYRAYCKAWFGLPILIGENEEFRKVYDETIRNLSYEQKIKIMAAPIDLPVTRLMTMGQKKRYLDDMYQHFTSLGVILTEPDGGQH